MKENKGARRQLKEKTKYEFQHSDHSRHWISAGYMTV